MTDERPLDIDYHNHDRVESLVEMTRYLLESVSLSFDKWGEDYIRGPGLYIAIVAGTSVNDYADVMGDNYWPVDDCRNILTEGQNAFEAADEVAEHCDGAVVVSVDGTVNKQMVRFRDLTESGDDDNEIDSYADWMGSRHMSAADTSRRDEVIATLTLSEETGRVTVFKDGSYEDETREEIAEKWRTS